MKQKEIPISIRAYARLLQVDEKAVRKAVADGRLKKGYDADLKKILPGKADAEWGNVHKVPKAQRGVSKAKVAEKLARKPLEKSPEKPAKRFPKPEIPEDAEDLWEENLTYSELIDRIKLSPNLPYQQAIRIREILGIAAERMKLEEQQGLLVRKADVEKALFTLGDSLKKNLLNIPARCIDDIRAAPNKVDATTILTMEIQQVLNEFAQHLEPQ